MLNTLFLPGASGSASFWKPVATAAGLDGMFLARPRLGVEAPLQDIRGIDDLIALTAREITEPVNIVAQSMGGLIAIQLALSMPGMVKRLVLAVTSGACRSRIWADRTGDLSISPLSRKPQHGSPILSATYRTRYPLSRQQHCFCGGCRSDKSRCCWRTVVRFVAECQS